MTFPKVELHVHLEGTVRPDDPQAAFDAGVAGALCDDETRERLRQIGRNYGWRSLL